MNNEKREKIAKAQNITSLIGKKLENEAKTAKDSKSKVNLDNLAENLASRRADALSNES